MYICTYTSVHVQELFPPPPPPQHAIATLEQIDWCLHQLESVDSAKAMGGPLAQHKFQRLLTRELSHMSEHSRSGNKLAEWVHDITGSTNGVWVWLRGIRGSAIHVQLVYVYMYTNCIQQQSLIFCTCTCIYICVYTSIHVCLDSLSLYFCQICYCEDILFVHPSLSVC